MNKVEKSAIDAENNNIVISNQANPNIIPYLFSLDKIEKTNCKLCQSELRNKIREEQLNKALETLKSETSRRKVA